MWLPPSDVIKDSPDDADGLAVDELQDTVDFNIPVRTGDQLTYSKPAAAPSFGLTHDRSYNVIVVEPSQKLQFGDVFEAGKVDAFAMLSFSIHRMASNLVTVCDTTPKVVSRSSNLGRRISIRPISSSCEETTQTHRMLNRSIGYRFDWREQSKLH